MNTSKYAKTPWTAEPMEDGCSVGYRINDADGYEIAVTDGRNGDGEEEANAHLLAAAPALLDALKWMVEHDDTNEGDVPLEGHGGRTWDEINSYWIDGLNRARAAIALATQVQS